MKKRYLFTCIALAGLTGWLQFGYEKVKEKKKKGRAAVSIDTTSLESFTFDVSQGYIGTLYAAREFKVNAEVGGILVSLNYDIGDEISSGDVVAHIDDTQYLLGLKQAQGKLEIQKSRLRQKELSAEQTRKEFERMTALREKKVVSESALEKAHYTYEKEKLTFDIDKANLDLQETAVKIASLRQSQTQIRAQWGEDGTPARFIGERYVDQGARITPNTAIVSVLDVSQLNAEIYVGEKEYPHLTQGMKVEIDVDAFPGKKFKGVIDRIAPFINHQTRQAKVVINVDNKDLQLRPGMFARTQVTFRTRKDVKMLPKQCLVNFRGKTGVYLLNEDRESVSFQPIEVGQFWESNVEILNADKLTLPVISVGQHMIRTKSKVRHIDDAPKKEKSEKKDKKKKSKKKEQAK